MNRRGTPEADAQRAIVQALRFALPRDAIVHHCANEVTEAGSRGAKRQSILVGMGVHAGFADLIVISGGRVLFLEVKSETGRLRKSQGWPARLHVQRWRNDLGLSDARIIATAKETRSNHPNPPDGPKALDRFMERAAQRDALAATANANGRKAKRQRKGEVKPPLSDDEKAAFYAKMVNADGYLPQSVISNTIRDAMLVRGLVTPERLRQRGVW